MIVLVWCLNLLCVSSLLTIDKFLMCQDPTRSLFTKYDLYC